MYHIKDEEFIKVKVPMTKEKIRVSIDKTEMEDICTYLDAGRGTGSISVEMAKNSENREIKGLI